MSKVSDLINEQPAKRDREHAKLSILRMIDDHALKGPEGYGVTFEGMTCARWQPWENSAMLKTVDTALSLDRLYMLVQFMNMVPSGNFYEFGVYNGGVTKLMKFICKGTVHAYDTFDGLKGATDKDLMGDGEYKCDSSIFTDTGLKGVELHIGDVRDTFTRMAMMSFAHIDLDLYEPTKHVLPLAYSSLVIGGYIVLDDYGLWMTPGVKQAVDEFISAYNNVKYIYLPTGQMVIMK